MSVAKTKSAEEGAEEFVDDGLNLFVPAPISAIMDETERTEAWQRYYRFVKGDIRYKMLNEHEKVALAMAPDPSSWMSYGVYEITEGRPIFVKRAVPMAVWLAFASMFIAYGIVALIDIHAVTVAGTEKFDVFTWEYMWAAALGASGLLFLWIAFYYRISGPKDWALTLVALGYSMSALIVFNWLTKHNSEDMSEWDPDQFTTAGCALIYGRNSHFSLFEQTFSAVMSLQPASIFVFMFLLDMVWFRKWFTPSNPLLTFAGAGIGAKIGYTNMYSSRGGSTYKPSAKAGPGSSAFV
jgi:hypothetical protein